MEGSSAGTKRLVLVYRVGLSLAALLVLGVTSYDIHRSIENNSKPATEVQLAALSAKIEQSRQATTPPPPDGEEQGRR